MTEFSSSRRRLIFNSAALIGGVAAVAAATRSAAAAMQQVDVPAQSPLGIAIANRCKVSSADHDAIRGRLMAELAANPSLSTLSEQCPICGCPIIVSR
jgi:hypothetical protein